MHISVKWFDDRFNFSLHSKPDSEEFLTVKGCRIVNGVKGKFISGPSTKKKDSDGYWNHTYMSEAFQGKLIEVAERERPAPEKKAAGQDFDDEIPF